MKLFATDTACKITVSKIIKIPLSYVVMLLGHVFMHFRNSCYKARSMEAFAAGRACGFSESWHCCGR